MKRRRADWIISSPCGAACTAWSRLAFRLPDDGSAAQPDGPVSYDADKCIGCRYCMWACPWGVPTAEWDSLAPKIQKCTHCADRADQPAPLDP